MANKQETFIRDDGETSIEVEFYYSPGTAPSGMSGPPEFYDPGEGPEIAIVKAWIEASPANIPVELTAAEIRRIEDEIAEKQVDDFDDYPDDHDQYDDWRDARDMVAF